MKLLLFALGVLLFAFGTSCTKLCKSGYEGGYCNTLSKTKFEGTWAAVDTPGNLAYRDTITDGGQISTVIISNSFALNHFAHSIAATVADNNITITAQQPDSNGISVQGSGTLTGNNTINWTYQIIYAVDSPAFTTSYQGIWVKQ